MNITDHYDHVQYGTYIYCICPHKKHPHVTNVSCQWTTSITWMDHMWSIVSIWCQNLQCWNTLHHLAEVLENYSFLWRIIRNHLWHQTVAALLKPYSDPSSEQRLHKSHDQTAVPATFVDNGSSESDHWVLALAAGATEADLPTNKEADLPTNENNTILAKYSKLWKW